MKKEEFITVLDTAIKSKNREELEALAKDAVAQFPENAFGYAYLAEALVSDYPPLFLEAEVCLAKALEIAPKNVAYLARFAELKDYQNSFDDAQIIWNKVVMEDPYHAAALLAIGSYQLRTYQDYQGALPFLNQSIKSDSNQMVAYLCRAEALHNLGKDEEALLDIDKVLSDGFEELAAILKINILKKINKEAERFLLYQQLIEELPDSAIHPFNYGQELMEKEEYAAAIPLLKKAIENSENPEILFYNLLGDAALEVGDIDTAEMAFATCVKIDAATLIYYHKLVKVFILQKKYEQALVDLNLLWERSEDNLSLKQELVIQKGMTLLGLDRLDQAAATFLPISKVKGLNQAAAFYGLGLVFRAKKEIKKGYRFMKIARMLHHPQAADDIKIHFGAFLEEAKSLAIKANEATCTKNEASPFLQKIIGKLWVFADLESKKLADIPAEIAQKLKNKLDGFSLLMTEKGIVIVSEEKEEILTYRIKKEGNKGALVELLPLDYFPPFVVKLSFSEEGLLLFAKEKNEIIKLKKQDLNAIPANVVTNFQKFITPENVAYLGAKASPVLSKLL